MTKRLPNSTHPGLGTRMAQLAEWMAESGTKSRIRDAAKALGWSYDNTKQVWRRIRKRMGPQAV